MKPLLKAPKLWECRNTGGRLFSFPAKRIKDEDAGELLHKGFEQQSYESCAEM